MITKLTKKKETLPQVSRYITKVELWTKNKLSYPKGIAEDEAVFFPLLALSESTVEKENFKFLINLTDDPVEKNNLISKYPEKAEELTLKWNSWNKNLLDPKWDSNADVSIPVVS